MKKHKFYMDGMLKSQNTLTISVDKMKKLAKNNDASLNELLMAIISNTFKDYFKTKEDKSDSITC